MDFRFLIVGAPFLIAFFYTLFWLKKWGSFNSTNNNLPKNIYLKNNFQIFDSGTSFSESGELLTAGGRVLSIVCQDKDFDKVFEKAYKNLKEIHFEGIYFRNDIGHQVRKNFSKEN